MPTCYEESFGNHNNHGQLRTSKVGTDMKKEEEGSRTTTSQMMCRVTDHLLLHN